MRKLVYVCSPCRGNPPYSEEKMKRNLERACTFSRYVAVCGCIPITPHLYLSHFLDDTVREDREMGMDIGKDLLHNCKELWVFGSDISEGMKGEIELARECGLTIHHVEWDCD